AGAALLFAVGCGNGAEADEGGKGTEPSTGATVSAGAELSPAATEPAGEGDEAAEPTQEVGIPPVPTLTEAPKPTEAPETDDKDTRTQEEIYQDMIERSLLAEGNNYRIKKVLEKARNGEEVLLAYIGGSITEGANASDATCYVTKSYDGFVELTGTEAAGNVSYVNAGLGGTSSALGVMRYDRDIVELTGKKPDIVFIEFSVNDWQEPTKGEAFESLIRRVYGEENEPAVVLVFAVFKSRWNMQSEYIPLGKLYRLPMISILDAVVPALDKEHTLDEDIFFSDIYHPTQYGHKIMADCITYMFEKLDAAEADEPYVMPEKSWNGDTYEKTALIDSARLDAVSELSAGGFSEVDGALGTYRYGKKPKTFPDNWMHTADSGDEAFRMTLTCGGLLMAYKQSSDKKFGSVDVYVDGEFVMKVDGYSEGGWNNPVPVQIIRGREQKEHTVEIRMSEGSEDKAFSILAFAAGQEKNAAE
ncbi:MAG: SGNH/GDSL hydrolase family protein, partial [Lachnospiraceae bacterium]|nr:SGNH/GDSL hydrolase family protein [Lachnospiraceae bacterium]